MQVDLMEGDGHGEQHEDARDGPAEAVRFCVHVREVFQDPNAKNRNARVRDAQGNSTAKNDALQRVVVHGLAVFHVVMHEDVA